MHGSLTELELKAHEGERPCAHPITVVTVNDLPWLLSLASERYRHFDPGRTLLWLMGALQNKDGLVIRTSDAFSIASILTPAWHPKESECHVLFLCAAVGAHWQAISLLRETIRFARERKCVRWWFSSETEHAIDQLARRVGAEPAVMRYKLDLSDGHVQQSE